LAQLLELEGGIAPLATRLCLSLSYQRILSWEAVTNLACPSKHQNGIGRPHAQFCSHVSYALASWQ